MKISAYNNTHSNVSRFKDFHEIQEDLNEVSRKELKERQEVNTEKVHEFKNEERTNKIKKEIYLNQLPYHEALMLRKLRVF